ncbi:hypothetical protein HYFRA_00010141 [Hymenoscyphus fraxineus]|uniref:Uncharacterized protein n=1 Tax=Hymenoscyphus fraxineus TaxID=746836 RepID=A0A9N9PSH1_9HELO|nr:hypothetical protein HYFRA_00010141 [Hymenoscyphus fraxineus]
MGGIKYARWLSLAQLHFKVLNYLLTRDRSITALPLQPTQIITRYLITMADLVSAFSGVAAILGLVEVLLHSTKRLYVFFGELKDVFECSSLAFEDKIHIPGVIRALNSCYLELIALYSCVKNADINDTDGKVKRMAKKMRFVSNHEEDISRSLRNIETSRKNLSTALLILNERCSISLREQIVAARHDVSNLEYTSKTHFETGTLEAMASDTSRRTQQLLTSDMQQSAKETQIEVQESVLAASIHTDGKLCVLANSIDPTRPKEATFEGFNLAAVTLPLMLVRPSLLMILQSLISGEQLKVSQSDVDLFSSQLGDLLGECHEVSARTGSFHKLDQSWTASPRQRTTHEYLFAMTPSEAKQNREVRWFSRKPPAGLLLLEIETCSPDVNRTTVFCGTYFAFIPNRDIVREGISVAFEKVIGLASQNTVSRNIRIFNILSPSAKDELEYILRKDDVVGLRKSLQKRTVRPWDRAGDDGISLLVVCRENV